MKSSLEASSEFCHGMATGLRATGSSGRLLGRPTGKLWDFRGHECDTITTRREFVSTTRVE